MRICSPYATSCQRGVHVRIRIRRLHATPSSRRRGHVRMRFRRPYATPSFRRRGHVRTRICRPYAISSCRRRWARWRSASFRFLALAPALSEQQQICSILGPTRRCRRPIALRHIARVPPRDCNGSKGSDKPNSIFFILVEVRVRFCCDYRNTSQRRGRINCRAKVGMDAPAEGGTKGPEKGLHRDKGAAPPCSPDGRKLSRSQTKENHRRAMP